MDSSGLGACPIGSETLDCIRLESFRYSPQLVGPEGVGSVRLGQNELLRTSFLKVDVVRSLLRVEDNLNSAAEIT